MKRVVSSTMFVACWLFVAQTFAAIEDRAWYRYKTEHFEIYSDRKPRAALEQIKGFEMFRAAVFRYMKMDASAQIDHVTKIFLLGNPRHIGNVFKQKRTVGVMTLGLRHNTIVSAGSGYGTSEVAYHEFVHYLLRNAHPVQYPAWYSEGIAELLSTVYRKDGYVKVGSIPVGANVAWMNAQRLHLRKIINTRSTFDLSQRELPGFYAGSWMFVHYLKRSPDAREHNFNEKLDTYLTYVNEGQDREASLVKAFGIDVDEFHQRLQKYSRGRFKVLRYPEDSLVVSSDVEQTRMSKAEIALELASVIRDVNPADAIRMYKSVLKTEPENAVAMIGLARALQGRGEFEAADAQGLEALKLGKNISLVHYEYAELLEQKCIAQSSTSFCRDSAVLTEAAEHYYQAQALAPDDAQANAVYGSRLLLAGQYAQAVPFLRKANAKVPSDYFVTRQLGSAALGAGYLDEARVFLQRAAAWSVDYPGEHSVIQELLDELAQVQLEETNSVDK